MAKYEVLPNRTTFNVWTTYETKAIKVSCDAIGELNSLTLFKNLTDPFFVMAIPTQKIKKIEIASSTQCE